MKIVILQSRMTFLALKENYCLLGTIILLLRRFVCLRGIIQYQFLSVSLILRSKLIKDRTCNHLHVPPETRKLLPCIVSLVNRFYYYIEKLK